MATSAGELSVRSHERVQCSLAAEVAVGETSAAQVRLAGSVKNSEGAVGATVVDCSLGGLGLRSPVYFPKTCRLRVRITIPDLPGVPGGQVQAAVIVQRSAMADRSPSYYLGCSFEEGSGGDAARALLDRVRLAARAGEPARA
jgi:hypothetical protein